MLRICWHQSLGQVEGCKRAKPCTLCTYEEFSFELCISKILSVMVVLASVSSIWRSEVMMFSEGGPVLGGSGLAVGGTCCDKLLPSYFPEFSLQIRINFRSFKIFQNLVFHWLRSTELRKKFPNFVRQLKGTEMVWGIVIIDFLLEISLLHF